MPVVEFEEEELTTEDNINVDLKETNERDPETGEENPNFIYEEEDSDVLPEVVKKEPLYKQEDIFVKKNQAEPTKPPKKKRVLTKELEEYVEDKAPPVVAKVQEKIIEREPTITKKDLEEAQLEAIIKYEALRKQRKKKKQEQAEEQKKKDETLNAIRRATQPRQRITQGNSGFWDDMY